MRKILLTALVVMLMMTIAYAAPDDDSTPYNPYPEPPTQPQTQPQNNKSDCPPKKTQAKKPRVKKKPAPRKKAARKKAPVKVSAPKPGLLEQAIALMEQGNYETAKRYLLRAINLNRRDPNVWYWYGKYHEYVGNFYQAQYFYSKAVKLDPSFEKLSRVVYYPNDPDKTPLWDPKRPARVYPVETSGRGVTTMRPDAVDRVTYPKAPDDPALPKVPVYTPPQPGSSPLNGDEWAPSVYVPPVQEESGSQAKQTPVYVPPAPDNNNSGIITEGSQIYQEVTEIVRVNQETQGQPVSTRESIVRADKPLYNPPEPGQRVTQVKKTEAAKQKQQKKSAKQESVKKSSKTSKKESKRDKQNKQDKKEERTPSARKTVRREQTPSRTRTQTQNQPPRTQTQTPEVRPTQPEQPRRTPPQTQNQNQNQERQEPREQPRQTQPQTQRQESRQQQYMPPVGQYAPDPGTISETPPPPVGQGN